MPDAPEPDADQALEMLRSANPGTPDEDLRRLLGHPGWLQFKAGEFFDQDLARGRVHLVVEGCLAWGERRKRHEDILQLPNPRFAGEIVGEWSFLLPETLERQGRRSDRFGSKVIMAVVSTIVKELDGEVYRELLDDPGFVLQVARRHCRDNATISQLISFHAAHEKEVVLARYLVIMLLRLPLHEIEGRRCLRITQENLARLSCLSRKYVGNFLRQWEELGIVEGLHGMIMIIDEKGLLERARIDATGIAPPLIGHPISMDFKTT